MQKIPFKAQLYIGTVYAVGFAVSCALPFIITLPVGSKKLWDLSVFLVLAIASGSRHVNLMRKRSDETVGSMSLGFIIIFAALLQFGLVGAVVVGFFSTLVSSLFQSNPSLLQVYNHVVAAIRSRSARTIFGTIRALSHDALRGRQPWYQLSFNISLNLIQTFFSSLVFLTLNGDTTSLRLETSLQAMVMATLSFYFINTGGVSTVIGLCSHQNPLIVWRTSFLWTAPSYFIGATFSTITVALLGNHLVSTLFCVAPVGVLTYYSYQGYMARAEALLKSKEQLADLYMATVRSLALAIDAKDQYTHQHILRVQQYAVATARQLGLSEDDVKAIETCALLHDIGKLGVPEYVLLKPGRLTEEEFAKIKEHPRIGADILDPVEFPWPVLPGVKYHHERWDGSGYPEGLKGENIPLQGRILAVADVYDALTSSRSYRTAWTHEKAVEEIRSGAGSHFDPKIVQAFLFIIEDIVTDMATKGFGPRLPMQAAGSGSPKTGPSSRADEAARDIQRASSELWALYEVAQTLSASLGVQDTLEILARKLEAILPGTACVFLIRENVGEAGQECNLLVARAAVGVNRSFLDGSRTRNEQSLSMRVAGKRETYLGEFDSDDLMLPGVKAALWTSLNTALIVPIIHQGDVLGTINLYHSDQNAFGPHDQQLLEMIAERAALALWNGLLFDRTLSHALTDALTGIANARCLIEAINDRCARATICPTEAFAILCIDLDSFKPINDNFGHLKGDQVLRDLAAILQRTIHSQDLVARYGGDEFVVVLDAVTHAEAYEMAERLQNAVTAYNPGLVHPRLGALRLGASIGVACFPEDGADCTTLLSVADASMYREKTERKLGRLVGPSAPAIASSPSFSNDRFASAPANGR